MLDAHPELAIPPETHFVPDLIDAIDGGRDARAGGRDDDRGPAVG